MLRAYFASMRLAFALVCVGISLLLGGQWLGFLPDVEMVRAKAQQDYCEAVSLDVAGSVRREQWSDLNSTLKSLVDHNDDLLSVGVRTELGKLRIDTGHHDAFWFADPVRAESTQARQDVQNSKANTAATTEAERRLAEFTRGAVRTSKNEGEETPVADTDQKTHTVEVPLTLARSHWGTIEFAFAGDRSSLVAKFANNSLLPFVCFFLVAGMFSYTFLMARVMGVFKSTQVVPDRVRRALDTLAEGLLVLDDRGKIVLANQAFSNVTGIASDDLTGFDADDLDWQFQDDTNENGTPWRIAIDTFEVSTGSIVRYKLPSGELRIFSVNSAPLGGESDHRGALVTFRDVTHIEAHRAEQDKMLSMLRSSRDEIHRKNRELERLATEDSLTGCLNRRAFFERFETLWKTAHANGSPLACLMFDNDHFKAVNDNYGHHIGDEVLRKVAKVIRDNHEAKHLVCRYGGEEFCVVLPLCDLDAAKEAAEDTRRDIMAIRLDDPAELRLTASIGVSELMFEAEDPQALINQADACLYIAKQRGRNRVVAYEPGFEDFQSEPEDRESKSSGSGEMDAIPFQAVTALLGALSYRDSDTAEHSCRVAELCAKLADGLLSRREVYVLEVAGLLHDVGKIGVPDHVLLKPGRLTAEEWQLMGQHDEIGVSIIEGTFGSPSLSEIIRTHHAFYGGGGREPNLPTGDDIPLGARILTIADSYDAMVSDRIYRKGRSHEEAVAELRRCAGTQFDPELVDAFIEKVGPTERLSCPIHAGLNKQAALRIGVHLEKIADAIDSRDTEQLRDLAVRLGSLAKSHQIESITATAETLERMTVDALEKHRIVEDAIRETLDADPHAVLADGSEEDEMWMTVLKETNDLMDLCRSTQTIYVGDTTERNRAVIERFETDAKSTASDAAASDET